MKKSKNKKNDNDYNVLKEVINYFNSYYGLVIALFGAIGFIFTSSMNLCEYIIYKIYFNNYELNFEFYELGNGLFWYRAVTYLLVGILIYLSAYLYFSCAKEDSTKRVYRIISVIFNFFISCLLCDIKVSNWIVCLFTLAIYSLILLFIEFLINKFVFPLFFIESKIENEQAISIKDAIVKSITYFVLSILLVTLCLNFLTINDLFFSKSFYVTDNSKVVVYTNKDYYLTLKCEIEDNIIYIKKGTQEKINTDGVIIEKMTFEEIK